MKKRKLKKKKSFRLSDETVRIIKWLTNKTDATQTKIIEIAVENYYMTWGPKK